MTITALAMNTLSSGVTKTTIASKTANSTKVLNLTNTTSNTGDTVPTQLTPELKLIQSIAQDQLGEFMDVKVRPDGSLVITANDKKFGLFDDAHSERSMGVVRSRLGLKEGILGKHNPEIYNRYSSDVQRGYGSTPDDGILAPGASIIIPASEVGKSPNIWQVLKGTFDDLKK